MSTSAEVMARILRDPEFGRAQAEAMADAEFQQEIAPLLNYRGPIDTSKARYHGFPRSAVDIPPGKTIRTHGVNVPEGAERDDLTFRLPAAEGGTVDLLVPLEPDTVNAIDMEADDQTWAHEYRHRQGIKNEGVNRMVDGWNAQNSADWDEAVRGWADWQLRTGHKSTTLEKAEADLLRTLDKRWNRQIFGADKELGEYLDPTPRWKQRKE